MPILFSLFLYTKCYNPIISSIPNIPRDLLNLQYQFLQFLPVFSFYQAQGRGKWNWDLYLLPITLPTSRVYRFRIHLNTWGFAFSTKLSIFCLYEERVLPSHLHPTHHRIPFSSHSSLLTPLASSQQGLCQTGSHASSALINFLPIFRLNAKLALNRFATHRAHFLAPHINTTPQCTIIFAEQTSDSFAIDTVTPL